MLLIVVEVAGTVCDELYILWSELSPAVATIRYSCPDNTSALVAQCELSVTYKGPDLQNIVRFIRRLSYDYRRSTYDTD